MWGFEGGARLLGAGRPDNQPVGGRGGESRKEPAMDVDACRGGFPDVGSMPTASTNATKSKPLSGVSMSSRPWRVVSAWKSDCPTSGASGTRRIGPSYPPKLSRRSRGLDFEHRGIRCAY